MLLGITLWTHEDITPGLGVAAASPFTDIHVTILERHALIATLDLLDVGDLES